MRAGHECEAQARVATAEDTERWGQSAAAEHTTERLVQDVPVNLTRPAAGHGYLCWDDVAGSSLASSYTLRIYTTTVATYSG